MEYKELNKSGNKRGCKDNNKQNFANDKDAASAAGKKGNKNSTAATQAITKSPVIAVGRNKRITPEIQQIIKDELTAVDKNGVPYIHRFIKAFLNEAKTDLNSTPARMLASAMFKDDLMTTLDAELNKQMTKDAAFTEYRIRQTLYDKQKDVFDDNTSRTIECICTRRAGKTELVARMLVREATKPPYITPTGKPLERNAIYLNRTFSNAVGQMGKPVTDILESLDIHYDGNPGSGIITLDNGNTITFGGYNNKGDIDKYRGFHYGLICCDEIGHLRNPEILMRETLEPALMDYGPEGRIIMTGTPPRNKVNYAYRQWHNPSVKHYHWSFMDNPFIPNKESVIEQACKDHGVTIDAPFIQREYYGNLEAFDTDALVFRGYKTYEKLPTTFDYAWIGVDWGFEDAAAVVTTLCKDKKMYVVRSWSESKKAISEICDVVKKELEWIKTNVSVARVPWVICDTNEKGAVYELYKTYGITNAYCAYKYDKNMAVDQLAEWLRTDTVFVNKDDEVMKQDLDNTLWKRDEESDKILHEFDDEAYHGNAIMALLYVSRQFAFDSLGLTDANKAAQQIVKEQLG